MNLTLLGVIASSRSQDAVITGGYFLDSVAGNDSNNGTSSATAWKTIAKLNAMFSSFAVGTKIYFKRGQTWNEHLIINKSGNAANPIVIDAYGSGAKPIISGFATVGAWTNISGNIWESTSAASTLSTCKTISIGGVMYPKGRTPKTGYWTIPSTNGSTTITDAGHLSTSVISIGAEVVIRELMYEVNNHDISNVAGNTITFGAGNVTAGWGYFLQNDVKTCTQANEWYFDSSTKKVGIYSVGSPTTVQIPTIDAGINTNGFQYLTFKNLDIRGFDTTGIFIATNTIPSNISVHDCDFSFIGTNAIDGYGNPAVSPHGNSPNMFVSGCTFTDIGSRGIYGASSSNAIFSANTLLRIGNYAGMGSNGDDSYTGIIANGDNSLVYYNNITNVGYCGIRWDGNGSKVLGNFVNTTNYVKDDGGGIYAYPVQAGNTPHTQTTRYLQDNIVLNSVGASAGSIYGNQGMGIYMDGQSPNTRIVNNTVNVGKLGYFINGGHDIYMSGNTSYDFNNGLYMLKIGGPISAQTVTFNNFVSLTGSLTCGNGNYAANYQPAATTMPADFVADNNVYASPLNQTNGWIFSIVTSGQNCSSLAQWQAITGKETGSTTSPLIVSSSSKVRLEYNETNADKIVDLGTSLWVDMKGYSTSGQIILPPFSSKIYLSAGTASYYVSPSGSDLNAGTSIGAPFKTMDKLINTLIGLGGAAAGKLCYVRGGVYESTAGNGASIHFSVHDLHGTSANPIRIWAYPNEKPIFTASGITPTYNDPTIMNLIDCDYVHLKGFKVTMLKQKHTGSVGDGVSRGFELINTSNSIIEKMEFCNIGGPGYTTNNSYYNWILNCDSHHNGEGYDTGYGAWNTGDGFTIGTGGDTSSYNVFEGCRSWINCDDGWDAFDWAGSGVTYKNCWSFWNGVIPWKGALNPDENNMTPESYNAIWSNGTWFTGGWGGEGFKLGGHGCCGPAPAPTVLKKHIINCMAFENTGCGFPQNMDAPYAHKMEFLNNISFGNSNDGFGFGVGRSTGIAHIFKNNIGWDNNRDVTGGDFVYDGLATNISNNWWGTYYGFNYGNLNAAYGGTVTVNSSDFLSTASTYVTSARQVDGSLPKIDFLKLAPTSDVINKGINVGLTYYGSAPDLGAYEFRPTPAYL